MGRKKGSLNKNKVQPLTEQPPLSENSSVQTQQNLQSDLTTIKTNMQDNIADAEPLKKRRASKIKEDQDTLAQQEAIKQTAKAFGMIAGMGMEFIAKRMPNPIPVSSEEKEGMGFAVEGVVEKYFPAATQFSKEFLLAGNIAEFVLPRMIKEKKQNEAVLDYQERQTDHES